MQVLGDHLVDLLFSVTLHFVNGADHSVIACGCCVRTC
jgi:hypothetical protein